MSVTARYFDMLAGAQGHFDVYHQWVTKRDLA
jgi:hypothetical protein